MADIYIFDGGRNTDGKFSIGASDGDNNYVIGNGSNRISSVIGVHIIVDSGTLSITVKGRSNRRIARRGEDDVDFAGIPYFKHHLNGSAADGSLVTTPITGTSIILIPASGMEVSLDLDNTDGVADVYVFPIEGGS